MVDLEVERVGELLAVGAAGLDEEAVLDVALEYEGVRLHWMTNFAIWQMKTKHKQLHIFLHFVKGNFMFIYLQSYFFNQRYQAELYEIPAYR